MFSDSIHTEHEVNKMKLALGILRAILKLAIFIGTAFFLMQPFVAIITTFAGTGTIAQRFTGFGSNLLHLIASLVLFYSGTIAIIAFSIPTIAYCS